MRKRKLITIEAEGRDHGKTFLIVEKSAFETEKWATRAMLALSRAGAEVPEEAIGAGAIGVLAAGLTAFRKMHPEDAEPLLDEMLTCIAVVPDPTKIDQATGHPITRPFRRGDELNDGDVEEVATLLKLRGEVIELHLGFSPAVALSNLAMAAATTSSPRTTSTSRKPAARSSRRGKPA